MRVGISGHRGLPPTTLALVDRALHDRIECWTGSDLIGVSMLADGPDQLFAQVILDRGGRLEVVVPAAEDRAGLPAEAWPA